MGEGVCLKAEKEEEAQALGKKVAAGAAHRSRREAQVAAPQEAVASPLIAEPRYLGQRSGQEAQRAVAKNPNV